MNLSLTRVDYVQVGLTSKKCMKIIPSNSSKSQQHVVVADQDGIIQLFSMNNREVNVSFKTLPMQPITRVELTGAQGSLKDKIFVSSGNEVRGFTKNGKQFLGLETNLTSDILSMHVTGADLLVCSEYVYNHYRDCQETNYFVAPDKINDVIALPAEKVPTLVPVLACNDRTLRVLKDSSEFYSVELDSVPTTLSLFYGDGGEYGEQILYGTNDGKIGLVQLTRTQGLHQWILGGSTVGTDGAVTCIDHYDVTGDGVKNLIVGHEGGSVQVFSYDDGDEAPPTLRFSQMLNESVTSVQGGVIGSQGYEEILASTYAGWIFGLTTEPMSQNVSSESGVLKMTHESKHKIQRLRHEIEELHERVLIEREKYQAVTQSNVPGVSSVPHFSVNDCITLNRDDASYLLTLEVHTSIDNVLLQSDVPVDLLDVDKNSAVVSYSTCDRESGNYLLATYRCQANTTRLEVKIRTIEGQYGTLQAYITPRIQPKCCQVRKYKIKPLSLHSRIHKFDTSRPYNTLTLRGQFTMPEMHSWIVLCFPEVPEKLPVGNEASYAFTSTFLDTQLQCDYEDAIAIFKSDNISTISILKDVITKEATKKKVKLEINCEVSEASIEHAIKLLHPKLNAQLILAKQVSLIEPLRELESQESDSSFLSPEYKFILDNADDLQNKFKKQPSHLERLYGMITDLYIDKYKFKGINVKSKVPQLLETLDNYSGDNADKLIKFFNNA